jgi:diguanylate cyclase (GGDEF)-like protein
LAVYALTGLMELAWTFALIPFRVDSYVGFAFFVGAMVVAISGRFAWLHRQVELGERDALTGCLTRHGFMTKLPTLLQAGGPLSCILFDLDHFKRINDTLGHIEGDRVLGATGHALRRVIRETDVAVRWGGEEFLVLLPAQALSTAVDVANRLRVALKRAETGAPFTASFGVSVREKNEGFETWIARTDRALYAAKQGGRDAIRSAEAA